MGVITFIWACLQYSGPMDLKEKHVVGHARFPYGYCLCASVGLSLLVFAWGVLTGGGFKPKVTGGVWL